MRLHQLMKPVGLWLVLAGVCLAWDYATLLHAQTALAGSSEEQGAKDQSQLSGRVVAMDDSPLEVIVVQAVRAPNGNVATVKPEDGSGDEVLATALTDAKGSFNLIGLHSGSYRVRVHTPGQFVYYRGGQPVNLGPAARVKDIEFRIAPFKKGTWRTYSTADGLPGNDVRSIVQEPEGALWFGTSGGIARFDGQSFQTFSSSEGLASSFVHKVAWSPQGLLWIATGSGVSTFDGSRFRNFGPEDGLAKDDSFCVYVSPNGDVWVSSLRKGLYRYDGTKFRNLRPPNEFPKGDWWRLDGSPDGTIWIDGHVGLVRFDGTIFAAITKGANLGMQARTPHVAGDGTVWFGGFRDRDLGVWRYDPAAAREGRKAFFKSQCQRWIAQ
jgi:hypothetical protein